MARRPGTLAKAAVCAALIRVLGITSLNHGLQQVIVDRISTIDTPNRRHYTRREFPTESLGLGYTPNNLAGKWHIHRQIRSWGGGKNMARIPAITREAVPEELRAVFDEVAAEPGGIGTGPMSVLKNSPEMARRSRPLFNFVRNESTVPKKLRELAMLLTARAMDCPYIWNAHVGFGREDGLSDTLVDALRDRQTLPPVPPDEAAVIEYATQLFQRRRVAPETFQAVLDLLGSQGLVELTTL